MAISIQCGACLKRIRVPDNLPANRQFRCPGCGAALVFTPPTPQGPEQAFAFGENPAPPSIPSPVDIPPPMPEFQTVGTSAEEVDAWRSVKRGTSLFIVAQGLYVVGLLLNLLVFFMLSSAERSSSSGSQTFLELLMMAMILALCGNWVLAVVAEGFWLAAPWRYGTRGMGIALLVLNAVILLRISEIMSILGPVSSHGSPREDGVTGGPVFLLIFYLLEGARLTVLAGFIQGAGRNLQRRSLSGSAGMLMVATPLVLGGLLALTFLLAKVTDLTSTMIKVLPTLNILGLVGLVIWGMLTLLALRSALRR